MEGHHEEEPGGLNEAWAVNMKRLVARELDHDRERQEDMGHLNKVAVAFAERMLTVAGTAVEAFVNSMDVREKDVSLARVRKEKNIEERMAELEETFNKQITATNEAISNINSLIQALGNISGGMAGVVGSSQQTGGQIPPEKKPKK